MTRYTIYFTGHVQGVGFRYTARELARNHDVAGFVENLPDRRVLLVAEGEPDQLDALVQAILTRMAGFVREHTIVKDAATGEFGKPGDGLSVRR